MIQLDKLKKHFLRRVLLRNLILDKSVRFSDDILQFCYEGFVYLYKAKDGTHTVAIPTYKIKEESFIWVYDLSGNYKGEYSHIDLEKYTRLKLDIDSQVKELFRISQMNR